MDVLKTRTILVVDDEKEFRKKYKKLLKGEGYKVYEAQSAVDVAEHLMRSRLDLILLDINIPVVDGKDIFDIIDEYPSQRPAIIVTSVYPVSEQKFKIRRAADYYDKSSDTQLLVRKVKNVLGVNKTEPVS